MSISGQYLLIRDKDDHPVDGESRGSKGQYWKSIDIKSWDWSVADQSSTAGKKVAGKTASQSSGKSVNAGSDEKGLLPELFKFTKGIDMSSIRLMQAMNNNERMKSATFVLHEERASGAHDDHKEFLMEVVLEDVYVVGYSLQGRAAEARVDLDESWDLHYKTIQIQYTSARSRSSSLGYMAVNFERKAGAERGSSSEKVSPEVAAALGKQAKEIETLRREHSRKQNER